MIEGMACIRTKRNGHMLEAWLCQNPDSFEDSILVGSIAGKFGDQKGEFIERWFKVMEDAVMEVYRSHVGVLAIGKGETKDEAQKAARDNLKEQEALDPLETFDSNFNP